MLAYRTLENIENDFARRGALSSLLGAYYADDMMREHRDIKGIGTKTTWMQTTLLKALTNKHGGQ